MVLNQRNRRSVWAIINSIFHSFALGLRFFFCFASVSNICSYAVSFMHTFVLFAVCHSILVDFFCCCYLPISKRCNVFHHACYLSLRYYSSHSVYISLTVSFAAKALMNQLVSICDFCDLLLFVIRFSLFLLFQLGHIFLPWFFSFLFSGQRVEQVRKMFTSHNDRQINRTTSAYTNIYIFKLIRLASTHGTSHHIASMCIVVRVFVA